LLVFYSFIAAGVWRPFIFFGIEQHDTRQERKRRARRKGQPPTAPRQPESKETLLSTSKKKDFRSASDNQIDLTDDRSQR
jgi:hypothetical protein